MRLARAIATLFLLLMILIGNFREPVRAITTCEEDCANDLTTCNNQVDGTYQSCITDCDLLFPWWSGCQNHCFSTREAGWAQCEGDYNTCLSSCPP
jgi:hypothetical protein